MCKRKLIISIIFIMLISATLVSLYIVCKNVIDQAQERKLTGLAGAIVSLEIGLTVVMAITPEIVICNSVFFLTNSQNRHKRFQLAANTVFAVCFLLFLGLLFYYMQRYMESDYAIPAYMSKTFFALLICWAIYKLVFLVVNNIKRKKRNNIVGDNLTAAKE
ncbi:MAG: hypothetical protein J5793_02385 [Clostridia bacterium]|nr:hypothetical protein [Clostridia bacterium]